MKRPVRLSDVARAAGISLGTASNAFNRPALVRPELRELVHATARELGYSGPDPIGRLLMGAKAHAIGVLPPGDIPVSHAIGSPYFREFMRGIAEICEQYDASMLVVSGARETKTWAIRNALVDGFILGHVEEVALVSARQRKAPFVVIDMDGGPQFHSVRVDGRDGARQAAEHLLGLGHRRFAIASVLRRPAEAIWHWPEHSGRRARGRVPDRRRKASRLRRRLEIGRNIDRRRANRRVPSCVAKRRSRGSRASRQMPRRDRHPRHVGPAGNHNSGGGETL